MKTKQIIQKAGIAASACLGLLFSASAFTDTLLFPVIAVNIPNVTTIISVVNASGDAPKLRYVYRHKPSVTAGEPNVNGICETNSFARNTYDNDIVSFDASGAINAGNALFNDVDVYGGSFALGQSGPNRAYLLVTHANAAGTRINVGDNTALSGEAVILDIASGAAWGMRGINDRNREDYEFRNQTIAGGGVYSALPNLDANKRFTFFPLDEWKTRFFITPIGSDMDSANTSTIVRLVGNVYDRSSTPYPLPLINPTVTCTGAVDLETLMDSTTRAAVKTSGGWALFNTVGAPAIVYKLDYVINDPTYGGTINNGYLLSDTDAP